MTTFEVLTPDATAPVFIGAPLLVMLAVLREMWQAALPRNSFDPLRLMRTIVAAAVLMLVAHGYPLPALSCWITFKWGLRHPNWPQALWRMGSAAKAVVRA